MAIARLQAMLGLDPKNYKAGLKDAKTETSGFQTVLSKVGPSIAAAFSVGAIIAFGKSVVDWSTKASIAARNMGMLTDEYIAFNRVALQSGVETNALASMMSKLSTQFMEAAKGNEVAKRNFDQLGISLEQFASLDPAAQFVLIAEAAEKSANPVLSLAKLFGEDMGPRAVTMLKKIATDGLDEISKSAGDAADKMEALGSKWGVVKDKAKGVGSSVGASVSSAVVNAGTFLGKQAAMLGAGIGTMGMDMSPDDRQKWIKSASDAIETVDEETARKREEREKEIQRKIAENKRIIAEEEEKRRAKAEEEAAKKAADEKRKAEIKAANARMRELERIIKRQEEADAAQKKAEEERQKRINEYDRVRADLNDLYMQRDDAKNRVGFTSVNADSLARSGGFFGGRSTGQIEIASKALNVQEEMKTIMNEINGKIGDLEVIMRTM